MIKVTTWSIEAGIQVASYGFVQFNQKFNVHSPVSYMLLNTGLKNIPVFNVRNFHRKVKMLKYMYRKEIFKGVCV